MMNKQRPGNWIGVGLLIAVLLIALVGSFLAMPKFLHQDTSIGSGGQVATPVPSSMPQPSPAPLSPSTPALVIPGASSGKTVYTSPPSGVTGFNGLAWSPDSKRVVSSGFEKVQIWDATTGGHLINVNLAGASATCVAWSPTGQFIAVGTSSGMLLVDSHSGKIVQTSQAAAANTPIMSLGASFSVLKPAGGGTGLRAISWSPDGRLIAGAVSAGASGSIELINAQTMMPASTFSIDGNYVPSALAWSADGHYLAATTFYTEPGNAAPEPTLVRVWKLATHQVIFQKPIGQSSNTLLAFQPGHDYLTFMDQGVEGQPEALEVWDSVTGKLIKSYQAVGRGPLVWSPDGHYLAYTGSGITILDMASGKAVYTYAVQQTMADPLTWSPDGKYIACIDEVPAINVQLEHSFVKVWLVA